MKSAWSGGAIISLLLLFMVALTYAASQGMPRIAGMAIPLWILVGVVASQWLGFIHAYLFQTERYYDVIGAVANISVVLSMLVLVVQLGVGDYLLAGCIIVWALRLGSFLFLRIMQDGGDTRFDNIKPSFSRFLVAWTLQASWIFLIQLAAILALSDELSLIHI